MVAAMREAGVPASVSQTAGTFVCNHVMYGLLHKLSDIAEVKGIHPYPLSAAAGGRASGSTQYGGRNGASGAGGGDRHRIASR